MTQVLRHAGVLGDQSVVGVSTELIGQDRGYFAVNARVRIEYNAEDESLPRSLVVKIPPERPEQRRLQVNENRFYAEAPNELFPARPYCYFSTVDTESFDNIIVMEDLGGLRPGDLGTGASVSDAEAVLRCLAEMHASHWNSPRLDSYRWVADWRDPGVPAELEEMFQADWKNANRDWFEHVPEDVLEMTELLSSRVTETFTLRDGGAATVVHGDPHVMNILFDDTRGVARLLDWEKVSIRSPMSDVAYFITCSMTPEVRRENESRLLDLYLAELKRHGVTDYTSTQMVEDYRRWVLWILWPIVRAFGRMDPSHDTTLRLMKKVFDRAVAVEDWDSRALLA